MDPECSHSKIIFEREKGMNKKFKKIFTNVRVLIVVVALALALIAISPNPFVEGVAMRGVETNSSASLAGMQNPAANARPMALERILSVNNQEIDSVKQYYDIENSIKPNMTVYITTTKSQYRLIAKDDNGTAHLGIKVTEASWTNIKKGLVRR